MATIDDVKAKAINHLYRIDLAQLSMSDIATYVNAVSTLSGAVTLDNASSSVFGSFAGKAPAPVVEEAKE